MSHVKNKVDWCLRKASNEIRSGGRHRGLLKVEPNKGNARKHVQKAEHYLRASLELRKRFSDIAASTVFYSVYHSLLAILAKFGYESGNQECTFALVYGLIEDGEIGLSKELLDRVSVVDDGMIGLRERFQYGVELSMKDELFDGSLDVAKEILGEAKDVVER